MQRKKMKQSGLAPQPTAHREESLAPQKQYKCPGLGDPGENGDESLRHCELQEQPRVLS